MKHVPATTHRTVKFGSMRLQWQSLKRTHKVTIHLAEHNMGDARPTFSCSKLSATILFSLKEFW